MFKSFIFLTIVISTLLFSYHAKSEQRRNDYVKEYNQLKNNYHMSKEAVFPNFGPDIRHLTSYSQYETNYNQLGKETFFKKRIIEWIIVILVIITVMSIPISLLWRFKFKVSAYLLAITTLYICAVLILTEL
ncbi:hypothetical protein BM1374166_01903 [Bartonella tribocorum]|nr:hypothetical protein BM1374166_01903 [Bartonella tribocorum]